MGSTQAEFYREYVKKLQGDLRQDRVRKIVAWYNPDTRDVLDVGCGPGTLLEILRERSTLRRAVGVDIAPGTPETLSKLGFEGYTLDAGGPLPFADHSFDTVICGEVIEHVFDVDMLVKEVHRVLRPGGALILSTPNLAYLPNRLLLLAGIQPIFTETSLVMNLGRRFQFLGQGRRTQGHLKIFTLGALGELLKMYGFGRQEVVGYRAVQKGPIGMAEAVLSIRPTLAPGFVVRTHREG